MGESVREGQAGERPVAEASERGLLAGTGNLPQPTAWAQPRPVVAAPDTSAVAPSGSMLAPGLPSRLMAGLAIASRRMTRRKLVAAVETELDRGAAFLFVPVFLAIGALVYFALPAEPALMPLVLTCAAVASLALLARSRRWLNHLLSGIAVCLLGMTAAKVETWRMDTRMLGGEISTRLSGRVVEIDHLDNGRMRLIIDVTATERPKLRYAPYRVRLTARKVPEAVLAGSQVSGYVRLMPPSGPVRPGSYDFSFESYFDGIGASGFFMKGPELGLAAKPPSPIEDAGAWIENARDRIAARIRDRIGGAEGEIAAALMVGVRGGIPEDANEALRRTGLYHIISISGLHMAMVAGTVMVLIRMAFAAFPNFSSRRPVKKYAAGVALVSTAAYLFVSGAEVAAQRSFIMLGVMLAAVLCDRAALTMRNLAISAIVVILVSPHEVVGPSFQMSFAATAALVGAYAWWSDRQSASAQPLVQRSPASKILRWIAAFVIGLVATSLIAGLATSVFGAWHFQRVSPLSLFANLAVMPIVSVLVMPFAVVAGVLMPLGLDGIFLDTMGVGLTAMIAVAKWFSARSPIDAVGLVSVHSVIFVTIALVIASMATTWLRLAALPFAAMGMLTLADARRPEVLVSEDGRLVAVALADGRLAVNRGRAGQFTIDNWKRALVREEIVAPPRRGSSGKVSAVEGAFVCSDGLCRARHVSGAKIAHAESAAAAKPACAGTELIVVDDATVTDVCPGSSATIITKRELARFGSAAIMLQAGPIGARVAEVAYAIAEPYRPWHLQRQFSRAARGLPPYQRESADSSPTGAAPK